MDTKDAYLLISKQTRKLGFVGKRGQYQMPLGSGTSGLLGVTATKARDGIVSAWVVVGIRHPHVYDRGVVLGAYPPSATNGTLTIAMKYLNPRDDACGEYRFVGLDAPDLAECARFAADISSSAVPFYRNFGSVDGALEAIRTDGIHGLQGAELFVPVALLLRGKTSEAVSFAEARLAAMNTTRGTGKQYASFVEALERMAKN
jgi:hypothetical protein